MPSPINGEAVNLGLVLLARDGSFAGARFTRDWSRVRALHPAADIEMLQAFAAFAVLRRSAYPVAEL